MRISGKMITVSSASLLFVIIVCSNLVTNVDSRSIRQKRTIFQLCTLINYYTNRTCTDYNDYGCYCGYGQAVGKPRDYADACCRKHDNCYGRAVESCYLFPQIVSIGYTCDDNTRQCRCTDAVNTCERTVCECETSLAHCLSRAPYHNTYYHMDRSECN
ncbi:basic phospholipase A2-like [Mytilus edulis]|uniref:basic phospholipase A2-like n=1 Tax=Mytilus edulis TaxID=6550 RepID=UPI0039EEA55E